jgi:hypothetical protein
MFKRLLKLTAAAFTASLVRLSGEHAIFQQALKEV